jgi:uncharacterized protein (TIGR02246 family)
MDRIKHHTSSAVVVVFVLILAGCAQDQGVTSEEARADIEAMAAGWQSAFNAGDGAGIAAHYTADAQLLPPNGVKVSGTENIAAFWQAAVDSVDGISIELEVVEVVAHGDHANDVGRFTMSDGDGNTMGTGKYMVLWRLEQGEWKMVRDIWNMDGEPAE